MSSGRRLWLVVGGAVAALLLGYGALTAIELLTTTTRTEQLTLPALDGVRRLRLDSAGGSVTVIGDDRGAGAISGTVRLRGGLTKPTHDERVEGDTLVLTSRCGGPVSITCDATYQLSIPRGMDVVADSSGGGFRGVDLGGDLSISSSGGGITLERPSGVVELDSSGGGITIDGGTAVVSAESSGGGIRLRDSASATVSLASSGGGVTAEFAEAPTSVRASSSGGGVTVELPDGVDAYRVDARSSGGSQQVRVRTDPAAERTIVVSSSGGDVDVRYRPG